MAGKKKTKKQLNHEKKIREKIGAAQMAGLKKLDDIALSVIGSEQYGAFKRTYKDYRLIGKILKEEKSEK